MPRYKPDHAIKLWGGIVGAALVADGVLIRHDLRSLTGAARDNPFAVAALVLLLAGHFLDWWGRWDPFRALWWIANWHNVRKVAM